MMRAALLLLACAAVAPIEATAQTSQNAGEESGAADFNGLWVVSNRTRIGPLDENLQPLTEPPFTPAAQLAQQDVRPALDPSAMCLPAMPRHLGGPYPIEIIQTDNKIALLFEWDNVFRLIHLDVSEHPNTDEDTRWLGHSIGRWEGATLVVETANFNGNAWLAGDGTPMSDQAHLTEWFSLADENRTLLVTMKIEDPVNLTRPIFRSYVFNARDDWELKEYLCAEGNRDNVFAPGNGEGSLQLEDVLSE